MWTRSRMRTQAIRRHAGQRTRDRCRNRGTGTCTLGINRATASRGRSVVVCPQREHITSSPLATGVTGVPGLPPL